MLIGTMLILVGILHNAVAVIVYWEPLVAILHDGIIASVPDVGDRAAAFWFTITGLVFLLLGACVRDLERQGLALPRSLAPGLLVLTLAIVIPMPSSGAWIFLPIAIVTHRRWKQRTQPS
ncbi:MAG: DUF6463 family protein [Polyangiales bacterium]